MRLLARRDRFAGNPMLFSRVLADDTYLVSFPRSGSTWLRCMLTTLVHGTEVTPELVAATVPDVHRSDRIRPRHVDPLVVKSHTPFVDIPAKVVYLVRDGRDAIMSFHYLQMNRNRVPPGSDPRLLFFREDTWPCPWHGHVTGCLDRLATRAPDRHIVVRYEDLRTDTAATLKRVLSFVDMPADDARIDAAVEANTKEKMQAKEGASAHLQSRNVEGTTFVRADRRATVDEVLAPPTLERLRHTFAPALAAAGYES